MIFQLKGVALDTSVLVVGWKLKSDIQFLAILKGMVSFQTKSVASSCLDTTRLSADIMQSKVFMTKSKRRCVKLFVTDLYIPNRIVGMAGGRARITVDTIISILN